MLKRKAKLICAVCAVILISVLTVSLLTVLLVPFNVSRYDDGGSIKITALTYSVVKWSKLEIYQNEDGSTSGGRYENTCIYLFPDNFKSLNELWMIRH